MLVTKLSIPESARAGRYPRQEAIHENAAAEMVEIACDIRIKTANSVTIVNGTLDDLGRPKVFWLPRLQVEFGKDGTVRVPLELAKEKGLI